MSLLIPEFVLYYSSEQLLVNNFEFVILQLGEEPWRVEVPEDETDVVIATYV